MVKVETPLLLPAGEPAQLAWLLRLALFSFHSPEIWVRVDGWAEITRLSFPTLGHTLLENRQSFHLTWFLIHLSIPRRLTECRGSRLGIVCVSFCSVVRGSS